MARRRTTDEERAERRRQTTQIRRRVSTCFGKVYGTSKLPGSPLEVYLLIRRKEDGQYYYFNSNPRTNFPPTPQDLVSTPCHHPHHRLALELTSGAKLTPGQHNP